MRARHALSIQQISIWNAESQRDIGLVLNLRSPEKQINIKTFRSLTFHVYSADIFFLFEPLGATSTKHWIGLDSGSQTEQLETVYIVTWFSH